MRMTVWYRSSGDERGVFELMDSKAVSFVYDQYWFSIVGDTTNRVYFTCPRENLISAREMN